MGVIGVDLNSGVGFERLKLLLTDVPCCCIQWAFVGVSFVTATKTKEEKLPIPPIAETRN